jgi:hypothetical protein
MDEIVQLNDRILDAEERGAAGELAPLLADNFYIIRASGKRLDCEAYLADVPNQCNRGRRAERGEAYPVGNCALYTCIVTTTQNPDGAANPGQFWNSRLFVREDGQWRCAAWQVTAIAAA